MTIGPGKHDDLCTMVREKTGSAGVLLITIGGKDGGSFSCQFTDPRLLLAVPDLLETVAAQIRKDGVTA